MAFSGGVPMMSKYLGMTCTAFSPCKCYTLASAILSHTHITLSKI